MIRPGVSAIAVALTETQRNTIVRRFTEANPHWTGARAPDILEALYDADSDLGQTEPFFAAHPDLLFEPGAGLAARALIWSGQLLTAANMRKLLKAARPAAHVHGSDRDADTCETCFPS
jgi:hypothetical protein